MTYPEDYEYDDPDDYEVCPRCSGDGSVICHCGGDMCLCGNQGDAPCPLCGGDGDVHKDRAARYLKHEAEMMAALRTAWEKSEQAAAPPTEDAG